jgi:hypothetical protein
LLFSLKRDINHLEVFRKGDPGDTGEEAYDMSYDISEQREDGMPASPRALRLRFTYEGDEVRLVRRQPVETITSPTDALSGYEGQQGFWVEVRSGQDEVLYRQVRDDPLRHDVEVFSPDPAQSVFRIPVENPSGTFSVLVPDLDEADHVALISSAAPDMAPEAARGSATELARFSLRPPSSEGSGA